MLKKAGEVFLNTSPVLPDRVHEKEGIRIKKNSGKKILKAAIVLVCLVLIFFGALAGAKWLSRLFDTVNAADWLKQLAKRMEKNNVWVNAGIALAGLAGVCFVLDSVAPKKRGGGNAVSSELIRGPIRRNQALFLLPMVAAFSIGFIWPFIKGVYLSFCTFKTTSKPTWVGLQNYTKAFADVSFRHAFWYTALYAVVSLILINVIAFFVAYILTQNIPGNNIFRTVFFMPNLIGGIVLGYIWSMIFDGVLSAYGTSILMETKYGFWGLIILMCWQQIGYMMIIYIAGLQSVPGDMLEAADIDGANRRQKLFRIVIPNVMPSITICTFLSLTNGFKLFDQNLALNGGQPFIQNADGTVVKTTEMIALNIYNTFYGQNSNSRGVAQAKAVLFFILVATLGLVQLSVTRKKEVQQ